MTLTMVGSVSSISTQCEKCGETIILWSCPDKCVKCTKCGAVYNVLCSKYADQSVRVECEFVEFQCIQNSVVSNCSNICPASGMYCKEHLTDECYTVVKDCIKYYEKLIETSTIQLSRMDEAKKMWLVEELSGLDDK